MKIKIETMVFIIFVMILNIAAIISATENLQYYAKYSVPGNLYSTPTAMAILAIGGCGSQIIMSIIVLISHTFFRSPKNWNRVLFFFQLVIALIFFGSAFGNYMEPNDLHGTIGGSIFLLLNLEAINGIFSILMMVVIGRRGWDKPPKTISVPRNKDGEMPATRFQVYSPPQAQKPIQQGNINYYQ